MDDPWKSFQSALLKVLDPLWYDFAKECRESEALAPLGRYPDAAAWLARSMSLSADPITRKLAAMLAGWIQDPKHTSLLAEILDRERTRFSEDSLNANSVAEDVMFAATRWTGSQDNNVRIAGSDMLATMVTDALNGIPWNTVHWATANLHRATGGKHQIFAQLISLPEGTLERQRFFANAVRALKESDAATLNRFVTHPADKAPLSPGDPNYAGIKALWDAAASAEATCR
jgi:hypothetical protein